MSGSESENFSDGVSPPKIKRGRPVGKTDSTQRTRRTAQEISDDKIRIAQMKLDALKETEEKSLQQKTRARPEKSKVTQPKAIVQEIPMAKPAPRDDSLSPSPKYYVSKKASSLRFFLCPSKKILVYKRCPRKGRIRFVTKKIPIGKHSKDGSFISRTSKGARKIYTSI